MVLPHLRCMPAVHCWAGLWPGKLAPHLRTMLLQPHGRSVVTRQLRQSWCARRACRKSTMVRAAKEKPPLGVDQLPNPYMHERCGVALAPSSCDACLQQMQLTPHSLHAQGAIQRRGGISARQSV